MPLPRRCALLWLLVSCAPKSGGDTADEVSPATAGSESSGTPATTTAAPTSGADDEATGGSGSTSTSAGTWTTGAAPDGGLPEACAAFCERFLECAPGEAEPLAACVQQCLQGYLGDPVCEDVAAGLFWCGALLTCDDFRDFVFSDAPTVCIDEYLALSDCGPGCLMVGSGGPDGCTLGRACGEHVQDYRCTDGTCTCFEDDVAGAMCPAAGFCGLDDAARRQAVNGCCGWAWP